MSLWRYFGSVIWRRLCVMKMILYYIFEQMEGLEHGGDVRMFGSTGNGMCESILSMLKVLNFSYG